MVKRYSQPQFQNIYHVDCAFVYENLNDVNIPLFLSSRRRRTSRLPSGFDMTDRSQGLVGMVE
jgi:hypothetical protein